MQIGWVYRPEITDYEKHLFNYVMCRHCDSFFYTPIAVATHEAAGNRYRFLCLATQKTISGIPSHLADIEVYKPVSGRPYATCLYRQDIEKIFTQRL